MLTSTGWWLGFAVSVVLSLLVQQIVENEGLASFEYHVENAQLAVQNRVRSYMDVLRGANALFYTRDRVRREEFHAYVDELKLKDTFPGITNLNFARRVSAAEKKAFEAAVRADTGLAPAGYPGFEIKPAGERQEYHVVTYIEPMEANLVSFGFDIASTANGAEALAIARDSGQLFSSGKLIRIQGPHQHFGLAMRMPLYRRGMPLDTVEQRRAAYYGSVGAGFDIQKLMLGAVDRSKMTSLRIRLFDIGRSDGRADKDRVTADNLLFDSSAAPGGTPAPAPDPGARLFIKRVTMSVGPRVWEMEFSAPRAATVNRFDGYLPWLVLVAGLIASTLLFGVYYSLTTARRRAIELAREMTKDLRASEASLAEAQHMARLGSWVLDPADGSMTWSAETYRIFGMDRFSSTPHYDSFLRCVHESDRQRVRDGVEKCLAGGEDFDTEHRVMLGDGTIRWVQTICRPGHQGSRRLLRGTLMDITERKQTVEALKRSQELLRELTAHQDRVKEDERKRIAREIHDELGQTLLALRIDVSMLEARTGKSHPKLNEKVRGALHHIDATVKTIRTIINNLRPAVLDLGLNAAIEWQVAEFRRRSGIACDLFMGDKEFLVDDARATSLFRILQESLTNVIRHANASHVVIELYQEDDRLVMKISDNGVGIYPEMRKSSNSFGLVGVEERIHALNGEFLITSAPGKGTTLTIYIPLQNARDELFPFKLIDSNQ
ncbi:MAG TPA: CHASE domain-containing protein [Noviherbaspirillum sp.]|nr:CHASE domain-containing protein [Noviherbaspirillum sp.]